MTCLGGQLRSERSRLFAMDKPSTAVLRLLAPSHRFLSSAGLVRPVRGDYSWPPRSISERSTRPQVERCTSQGCYLIVLVPLIAVQANGSDGVALCTYPISSRPAPAQRAPPQAMAPTFRGMAPWRS